MSACVSDRGKRRCKCKCKVFWAQVLSVHLPFCCNMTSMTSFKHVVKLKNTNPNSNFICLQIRCGNITNARAVYNILMRMRAHCFWLKCRSIYMNCSMSCICVPNLCYWHDCCYFLTFATVIRAWDLYTFLARIWDGVPKHYFSKHVQSKPCSCFVPRWKSCHRGATCKHMR